MKVICLFITYFIVVGCSFGYKSTEGTSYFQKETEVRSIASLDTTIKVMRTITPFNGEVYYSAGWEDTNGENIFIISKNNIYNNGTGRVEVHGYHYIKYNNSWKKNWYSFDFVDGDGCDLAIDIPKDFIRITDIDNNTIAEISYLYTLDDRCDAVVVPTKMVVSKDKTTYSISGFSQLSLGPSETVMNQYLKERGEPLVSYKKVSENWKLLDKSFQDYYSQLWDEYVDTFLVDAIPANRVGNKLTDLNTQNVIDSSANLLNSYNLINDSFKLEKLFQIFDFEFPKLKYIDRENGWVVIDTSFNHPETYSTIEDYIGESNYKILYSDDYLRIENRQRVISEPLIVIEAKAFKTNDSSSIIGINYSYSSRYSFAEFGYRFFEVINDSIVKDVTFKIFEEPALEKFFIKNNKLKIFENSGCIDLSMDYQENSESIFIRPEFTCSNMCDYSSEKHYKKMCKFYTYLQSLQKEYTFDKITGKFSLLNEVVLPIRTD